ncbi:MAG TPA: hypothetical protein VFA18_23875 [Gemmataceae bacterium]|nr:hypothetical protein [Gemmataceae bacterium]
MITPHDSPDQPAVPPLSELLTRYLARQASAHQAGLAAVDAGGEITPYEAIPVQSIDPRLAWHEAVAVAAFYHESLDTSSFALPPDWSSLVATQEPAAAVPFCFANFPQLVRNLQALLHATDLSQLHRSSNQPVSVPSIVVWAEQKARGKDLAQAMLSAGVLRLARQFDGADEALQRLRTDAPAAWQGALANEQASLAWSRGRLEEAATLWQSQAPSVPALFNRGMSALFLGRQAEARPWLQQAVEQLPETDGWHHLGRLYLALA